MGVVQHQWVTMNRGISADLDLPWYVDHKTALFGQRHNCLYANCYVLLPKAENVYSTPEKMYTFDTHHFVYYNVGNWNQQSCETSCDTELQ